MKKILFLLLFLLFALFATAQHTFKFGNVTLNDTLNWSIVFSGNLYSSLVSTSSIVIPTDEGQDFYLIGQNLGLVMYMDGNIAELYPEGFITYVPFYPPLLTTSEINSLSVSIGAMVINSDTGEVWV